MLLKKLLRCNSNKFNNWKRLSKTVNKLFSHLKTISSHREGNFKSLGQRWKSSILSKQLRERNLSWSTGCNFIKKTIRSTTPSKSIKLLIKSTKLPSMISRPKMIFSGSIFWADSLTSLHNNMLILFSKNTHKTLSN